MFTLFLQVFDELPHYALLKELLIQVNIFTRTVLVKYYK